jgi:lipoate-protein ligase A
MDRDRGLWDSGEAIGRVYTWDGVWISLGKSQTPDRVLLPGVDIPTVPRPTGGKAVLHGHDITIGASVPLAVLGITDERQIKAIYRRVCEPLATGLTSAGIPTVLAEGTQFVDHRASGADCFAVVSPNDLIHPDTGQKVCGCALAVSSRAVLIQASVPIRRPYIPAEELMVGGKTLWSRTSATPEQVCDALRIAFGSFLGGLGTINSRSL